MQKQPDTSIKKTKINSLIAKSDYSINDVMQLLKSIEEKHDNGMKIINNKLTFYEKSFCSLKNSLDNLTASFNNLKAENDLIKTELNTLRDKIKSTDSVNSNKNDIINEVNHILSRSRNIIFFNLPENTGKTDDSKINDVISTMNLNLSVMNLQ